MSRAAGGTYTLPAGNPVVTGTTIATTWANPTMSDIATALTDSLSRSGLGGMTAALLGIDGTAAIPAYSFTNEPTSGFYRAGAGNIALSVLNRLTWSVTSAGNMTIATPSSGAVLTTTGNVVMNAGASGNTLAVTGIAANSAIAITGVSGANLLSATDGTTTGVLVTNSTKFQVGTSSAHSVDLVTSGTQRLTANSAGNVSVNAPTSGTTVALTSVAAGVPLSFTDGTVTGTITFSGTALTIGSTSAHTLNLATNAGTKVAIASAGNVTVTAPSSGVALTVNAVAGTHSTKIADSANATFNAGFLELPINTQNAAYTTVLADAGKAIYHSDGTARTYTIDSNANVAYPIGTTITFVNDASGAVNVTIAITTDTLVLSPGGTTGSRTLAQFGRATAHKVTSTRWIISGSGLT